MPGKSYYMKIFLNWPIYTWFERVSMLVILLNCVTLGMYQPCVDDQCVTNRCKILQVINLIIEWLIGFIKNIIWYTYCRCLTTSSSLSSGWRWQSRWLQWVSTASLRIWPIRGIVSISSLSSQGESILNSKMSLLSNISAYLIPYTLLHFCNSSLTRAASHMQNLSYDNVDLLRNVMNSSRELLFVMRLSYEYFH